MAKAPQNQPRPRHELTSDEAGNWETDQKNRGYYYDDSHGYEVYRPDADAEEDDEDADHAKREGTPAS